MPRDCADLLEHGIGVRCDLFGVFEHQCYGGVKIRLQRLALWQDGQAPGGSGQLCFGWHEVGRRSFSLIGCRFENEWIPPWWIADRLQYFPHLREKAFVAYEAIEQQVLHVARLLSDEACQRIERLQIA